MAPATAAATLDNGRAGAAVLPLPPRLLADPGAPPPLDRVRALAAALAPALALFPGDPYNPCSGPWFAAHSRLLRDGQEVAPLGGTTLATALAAQAALGGPGVAAGRLRLDLDPAARSGQPIADLNSGAPLYCRAQLLRHPSGRPRLELTYLALYAYNGTYHLAGFGPGVGHHDGDWERMTVRVDPESGEVAGVWFNSHRPRDGAWTRAAAAPRLPGGRLLAYVARHGHGVYPTPGVQPRAFGVANDRTAADGPLWAPTKVVLVRPRSAAPGAGEWVGVVDCRGCEADDGARGVPLPPAPPAVSATLDADGVGDYAGQWGTVPAPRCQGWWARAECPASRSAALRLFCQPWPEPA